MRQRAEVSPVFWQSIPALRTRSVKNSDLTRKYLSLHSMRKTLRRYRTDIDPFFPKKTDVATVSVMVSEVGSESHKSDIPKLNSSFRNTRHITVYCYAGRATRWALPRILDRYHSALPNAVQSTVTQNVVETKKKLAPSIYRNQERQRRTQIGSRRIILYAAL